MKLKKNKNFKIELFAVLLIILGCDFSPKVELDEVTVTSKEVVNKFKNKVIDRKLSIDIPSELPKVEKSILKQKYASAVRPIEVYASQDFSVSYTFNIVDQKVEEEYLPELQKVMAEQFESVYPNIIWHENQIRKSGDRKFIVYEFESTSVKNAIYSLAYITLSNNQLLVTTFNCQGSLKKEWSTIAKESMESIKII